MPRTVFYQVMSACITHSDYIRKGLRPNCVGKIGISPLIKVICALRMLSCGLSADLADDIFNVAETTAQLCLKAFSESVIYAFFPEYLRDSTADDIARIKRQFASAGFLGCIGCLDCAG